MDTINDSWCFPILIGRIKWDRVNILNVFFLPQKRMPNMDCSFNMDIEVRFIMRSTDRNDTSSQQMITLFRGEYEKLQAQGRRISEPKTVQVCSESPPAGTAQTVWCPFWEDFRGCRGLSVSISFCELNDTPPKQFPSPYKKALKSIFTLQGLNNYAMQSFSCSAGKVAEIVVPIPSLLSSSIVPWWYCTTCFTIERPSPVPPDCFEWLLSTR